MTKRLWCAATHFKENKKQKKNKNKNTPSAGRGCRPGRFRTKWEIPEYNNNKLDIITQDLGIPKKVTGKSEPTNKNA